MFLTRSSLGVDHTRHHFENVLWHRLHLNIAIFILRIRSYEVVLRNRLKKGRFRHRKSISWLISLVLVHEVDKFISLRWLSFNVCLLSLIHRRVLLSPLFYFLLLNVFG